MHVVGFNIETGRGLLSKTGISKGQTIISIPKSLLLTPTLLSNYFVNHLQKRYTFLFFNSIFKLIIIDKFEYDFSVFANFN